MKRRGKRSVVVAAFTLLETLAALMIAAMMLSVLLMVYDRARSSVTSAAEKLDQRLLPAEILQRLAEDLDRLATPGADTRISVENKFDEGYSTARFTIVSQIYDGRSRPRALEKIIWQTNYDLEAGSLVLYRSHSGLALEDKLLGQQFAENPDREIFIPLCSGVTFFQVQALQAGNLQSSWLSDQQPAGLVVTISFAEPFEATTGGWDVPQEEKIARTISIDRTRKIKLSLAPPGTQAGPEQPTGGGDNSSSANQTAAGQTAANRAAANQTTADRTAANQTAARRPRSSELNRGNREYGRPQEPAEARRRERGRRIRENGRLPEQQR
jgi:type II secretory pathway component PulJ